MMIDRSRRITFEEQAELYDEISTKYPQQLVDDILDLSGIPRDGYILEIGCGPGNATLPFAKRGFRILAIELGKNLAEIAASHCREYPKVEIVNTAFEDWENEPYRFDLAISADAFHWIPPEIGYPKVARALKPSGAAGFFWNIPVDPNTDWSRAMDEVYTALGSQIVNPHTSFTLDWVTGIIKANFKRSGVYQQVHVGTYHWSETYTRERYLKSMRTYSSHRDLEEATRQELYSRIGTVIDKFGGQVEMPRQVALFHARVRG